jgi:hypothetical protein
VKTFAFILGIAIYLWGMHCISMILLGHASFGPVNTIQIAALFGIGTLLIGSGNVATAARTVSGLVQQAQATPRTTPVDHMAMLLKLAEIYPSQAEPLKSVATNIIHETSQGRAS